MEVIVAEPHIMLAAGVVRTVGILQGANLIVLGIGVASRLTGKG